MDIIKFKREQEQHKLHIQRIRNIKPCTDTTTPKSLGLKHLAVRPKKLQLIEDRRQLVAQDNAKLMNNMTKIMTEKRRQQPHERPPSLNEVERKREVDRVNFENKLMQHRLKTVPPVIVVSEFEEAFKKHLEAESHLRRRQLIPLGGVPSDLGGGSSKKLKGSSSEMFDSSQYSVQHQNYSESGGESSASPIRSMSDFRKHVIATKKADARRGGGESPTNGDYAPGNSYQTNHGGTTGGASPSRQYDMTKNDASLFEFSHNPSDA